MKPFIRKHELAQLEAFAGSGKAELMYLRGRRRVGKSWLLQDFANSDPGSRFLFAGASDISAPNLLKSFINRWAAFSGDQTLLEIKASYLDWSRVFQEVHQYTQKATKSPVLILDEIQWICREGTGFAGALKEAWVGWQKGGLIKVIICGSSNKFFTRMTGGEEKILRGLQTRAHLWVRPFTPAQVKSHCFPNWNMEEACLTYMMTGGIPYYLERLNASKGFIHAVNGAFFTQSHNLLDEVEELLDLDFNNAGKKTVEKMLSVLGQAGCEQKNIALKTGIPKSSLSKMIEKLLDYEIVFSKKPAHCSPKRNGEGVRYYMKDFFLNFYYQILAPLSYKIKNNGSGLIFPEASSLLQTGYFIPDFSGLAFELLVRVMLENRIGIGAPFFTKMMLKDDRYQVLDYWDNTTQIDIIIECPGDRISRVVECKWGKCESSWIHSLKAKSYTPPVGYSRMDVLVMGNKSPESFEARAARAGVTVISMEDYFNYAG